MSEPRASEGRGQLDTKKAYRIEFTPSSPGDAGISAPQRTHPRLVSPSTGKPLVHPLFAEGDPGHNAPPWLRPFLSLRVQLLFVYSLILAFVVLLTLAINQSPTTPYTPVYLIGLVILGIALAFTFTSLLLRPLWRVTDAAQAIAIGDLKQRERLPLRMPPQDEIDRLAGSINEMVTRLEHAEEMQHASEQSFKRFFSDASHQLRTPLTSIRGFTEVLMRGAKDDPETAMRVLKRMKNESERMTHLINDLLTLARLDDSTFLKKQYIDLVELASEGIEQARTREKGGRSITLNVLSPSPLGLQADKERLKQLLFILLDNALKHGRAAPEGIIKLELEKKNGQAIVRVIDNGNGIARSDVEHIFDSFYRGQNQSSPKEESSRVIGAGLGLTVAVAIIRAHQGSIAVQSELEKGTEFTVSLPCLD